jgi:hypothetical protein
MKISLGKQKITVRRVLLYLLIVAGVVLFLYLLVYQPYEVRKDRERYKQAEAVLEPFRQEVEKRIGQADQVKTKYSCSRPHLKYTRGPLGCDVSIRMLYESRNSTDSTNYLNIIKKLGADSLRIGSGSAIGNSSFESSEQNKDKQIFFQDYVTVSDLACVIAYSYPVKPSSYEFFTVTSNNNFEVDLSCGGPAKAEFYPLED